MEVGGYNTFIVFGAGYLYFRVMGYGLSISRRSRHAVLFSERYGYRKVYYLGPVCFWFLAPRE